MKNKVVIFKLFMLKYFVYLQRSSSIIIFIFCCILHRVAIFGLNNHKDNVKSRLHIHFFFFSIRNMWKYIPHRERTLRSTCKNYFFFHLNMKISSTVYTPCTVPTGTIRMDMREKKGRGRDENKSHHILQYLPIHQE